MGMIFDISSMLGIEENVKPQKGKRRFREPVWRQWGKKERKEQAQP